MPPVTKHFPPVGFRKFTGAAGYLEGLVRQNCRTFVTYNPTCTYKRPLPRRDSNPEQPDGRGTSYAVYSRMRYFPSENRDFPLFFLYLVMVFFGEKII